MEKHKGLLVAFEGIDQSGKSTMIQYVNDKLLEAGIKTKVLQFPMRSTPIGSMINEYLKTNIELEPHVAHLLFSANRWEFAKEIEKMLNEGTTVILDRYIHSGLAYSCAKADMDMDWCKHPDFGLPEPDVVFFLFKNPLFFREFFIFCYWFILLFLFFFVLDKPDDHERYETIKFQFNVNESYIKIFQLEAIQEIFDTQVADNTMCEEYYNIVKERGHTLIDRNLLKTRECVVVFGAQKNESTGTAVFDYIKGYREKVNYYNNNNN